MAEGIRIRHGRSCRSRAGGNCNCEKTYEASVWSRRDGKKLRRSFHNLEEARHWRADALKGVKDKTIKAPSRTTVREACEAWFEDARAGLVRPKSGDSFKPSVIRSYDSSLNTKRKALGDRSILDELGARKLSDISRVELQKLADRLSAERKDSVTGKVERLDPSTVRNALMPLRAVFRRAIRDNEIAVNPTAGLDLPAVRGRRERIASPEEASRLISLLANGDRCLWSVAFYAGLRLGELLALRWEDVDLAAGVVHVRRAYDERARVYVEPKSRAGRRDVPVAAVLRDALVEHKLETGRESGLMFGRTAEQPFSQSAVTARAKRTWVAAEKKRLADVEAEEPDAEPVAIVPIGLHEARHTCASLMIAARVNIKAISTYMGHSSITITLDRYGHLLPGSEEEAAGLLDAYLERANTQGRLAQLSSED